MTSGRGRCILLLEDVLQNINEMDCMPAPALKKECPLLNLTGKGYLLLKQHISTPENCPSLCSTPRFEEMNIASRMFYEGFSNHPVLRSVFKGLHTAGGLEQGHHIIIV